MNEPTVSLWTTSLGIWPLLVMMLPNLMIFRKYGRVSSRKRAASLYHAIAVFLIVVAAGGIVSFELTDTYLLLAFVIVGAGGYVLRKQMFPYHANCVECGKKHELFTAEFKNIYVMDDDLCDDCRASHQEPEEV